MFWQFAIAIASEKAKVAQTQLVLETNAYVEAFNSKIKDYRRNLRGCQR